MQLSPIRLLVGDFSATVTFWRDVMQLPMKYHFEEMGYAYFEAGDVGLELISRDVFATTLGEATPLPAPTGRQFVLTFKVDNVDTTYAELVARGATSVTSPQDRPEWGARTAHLSGPEGHLIEIYAMLQQQNASPV